MTVPSSTLLSALREATAASHRRLEATPCMARLGTVDLAVEELRTALIVLRKGFSALEPVMADEPWYRPQLPALTAELQREGRVLPSVATAVDGSAATPAARLGIAYVLVGSRLGAAHIAARLGERFGTDWLAGSPYYGAERPHARGQWQALCVRLAAAPRDAAESAVAAALAAFATFNALSLAATTKARA